MKQYLLNLQARLEQKTWSAHRSLTRPLTSLTSAASVETVLASLSCSGLGIIFVLRRTSACADSEEVAVSEEGAEEALDALEAEDDELAEAELSGLAVC